MLKKSALRRRPGRYREKGNCVSRAYSLFIASRASFALNYLHSRTSSPPKKSLLHTSARCMASVGFTWTSPQVRLRVPVTPVAFIYSILHHPSECRRRLINGIRLCEPPAAPGQSSARSPEILLDVQVVAFRTTKLKSKHNETRLFPREA